MRESLMVSKVHALMRGETVKFSRGSNRYSLMSERQQSQLFNLLHREFGAQRMRIAQKDAERRLLTIQVEDLECNRIIDAMIQTY